MFCHVCGTQISEGAEFCHKCGTRVVYGNNDDARKKASDSDGESVIEDKCTPISSVNDTGRKEVCGDEMKGEVGWFMKLPAFWKWFVGIIAFVCIGFVAFILISLLIIFLRWAFSSFISIIITAAGGYILYHKGGAALITEFVYKRKSKALQLPEGMSAQVLLETLSGKFNYPYLKGIHYGEIGECVIEGKYSMYPVVFNESNSAELSYISKDNDKKKRTILLEAMAIRDYINKFFNPALPIDVVKDMRKLKFAEGQRKAVAIVSAVFFILGIVAVILDLTSPGSLQKIMTPGIEVRGSYLSQYSEQVTIEKAFENYFEDGKWSKYDSDGYTNVVFTGTCMYSGKWTDIRIVFKLTGKNFIVDSLDINGRTQNNQTLHSLLSDVYEGYNQTWRSPLSDFYGDH